MLIGLNAYPGDCDAVRRQEQAGRCLKQLPDVEAVNLQFRAGPTTTLADIETLPVLSRNSTVIAGPGRRSKPITRDDSSSNAATRPVGTSSKSSVA